MNPTTGTDRLIRRGHVAVLFTPRHGGGWSTWNDERTLEIMFDPQIADIVDARREDWVEQARAIAEIKYPDAYLGGIGNLQVMWVPLGAEFRVVEYDGYERVEFKERLDWITA